MIYAGILGFVTVDLVFLTANLPKIAQGGWFPLLVGAAMFTVLTTWDRGRQEVTAARNAAEGELGDFIAEMHRRDESHVPLPGVGVFLNPTQATTPLALRVSHDKLHAVPREVIIVSVEQTSIPHVGREERAVFDHLGYEDDGFSHITLRFGFRDQPHVPRALNHARQDGCLEVDFNPYHATYFLSQVKIVPERDDGMPGWRKALFVAMARNATSPADFFHLPAERVVTLGAQVAF